MRSLRGPRVAGATVLICLLGSFVWVHLAFTGSIDDAAQDDASPIHRRILAAHRWWARREKWIERHRGFEEWWTSARATLQPEGLDSRKEALSLYRETSRDRQHPREALAQQTPADNAGCADEYEMPLCSIVTATRRDGTFEPIQWRHLLVDVVH